MALFCSDDFWARREHDVLAIDPDLEVVQLVGTARVSDTDLDRIDVAHFSTDLYPERSSLFMGACVRARRLRWLQSFSAGTDHPVYERLLSNGVNVTTGTGAGAPSIAQSVLGSLLALSRDLPRAIDAQRARRWEPRMSIDIEGRRVGVIGMGAIGAEVARLTRAVGFEVVGMRRTPTGGEPTTTWSSDRFEELLRWADAIVVATPLTDATRGLFDAAAFAEMRPGAWFINVGRGEVVDEPALIDALERGHLGGAALDVFTTEPLPPEHPLWTTPNAIITAHCSGATERSLRRADDIFVDNLRRWLGGEPLVNGVSGSDST